MIFQHFQQTSARVLGVSLPSVLLGARIVHHLWRRQAVFFQIHSASVSATSRDRTVGWRAGGRWNLGA